MCEARLGGIGCGEGGDRMRDSQRQEGTVEVRDGYMQEDGSRRQEEKTQP